MSGKTNRREFVHAAGLAAAGIVAASPPLVGATAPRSQSGPAPRTMGARFRQMLQGSPFECMGVYDVMTARLAEIAESPSLFLGSSAVDEFYGVPGYGLTPGSYKIEFGRRIAGSVDIPALIDVDDDASTPLILYRDVREFERAGLGAIHIVDGRPSLGGGLFPESEMVDRIRAAVDARSDMVVTARCQAAGSEGIERAIERGAAYGEAGAEAIWYTGVSFADLPRVAEGIGVPLIGQLGSDTTVSEARDARLTVMIYASLVQNIAQSAVYDALTELRETGRMAISAHGVRLGNTIPSDVTSRMRRVEEYQQRGRSYNLDF